MKTEIEMDNQPYVIEKLVVKKFGCHPNTAYEWRKKGLLPGAVKLGRSWYYPLREIEQKLRHRGL